MKTHTENLYQWAEKFIAYQEITPLTGDASFRRYFRVQGHQASVILVDAPPLYENNVAFIAVAKAFRKIGLIVPEVLEADLEQGFMLLTDLGDAQLLKVLNPDNVEQFYTLAIKEIIKLQTCQDFGDWQLPHFDQMKIGQELSHIFQEWYLERFLGINLTAHDHGIIQATYSLLIESALSQPQVCVHRDYHSRNLMVSPDQQIGLIDFQDAVIGPITYDLVSLLRDCYITWPPEIICKLVKQFWQQSSGNTSQLTTFFRWFDLMGLQRHLKALGIFARVYLRDHKTNYLQDIPRTLNYINFVCEQYPELAAFSKIMIRVSNHESYDISSRSRQSDASAH